MSKKKVKVFSLNSMQKYILKTLRHKGHLEKDESGDFYLLNALGKSIPVHDADTFSIHTLILKSYIKASPEIVREVPVIIGEEPLKLKFIIYTITSKGLTLLGLNTTKRKELSKV